MAFTRKPKKSELHTGTRELRNFLKKSAYPNIAKNQSPIGSKAALTRKAARASITI
jgi:hypothetical protein